MHLVSNQAQQLQEARNTCIIGTLHISVSKGGGSHIASLHCYGAVCLLDARGQWDVVPEDLVLVPASSLISNIPAATCRPASFLPRSLLTALLPGKSNSTAATPAAICNVYKFPPLRSSHYHQHPPLAHLLT